MKKSRLFIWETAGLLASACWSLTIYQILETDLDPWSELSYSAFALASSLPLLLLNVFLERRKNLMGWRRKSLLLGIVSMAGITFFLGAFLHSELFEVCHNRIGRGSSLGSNVVVYSCAAMFHEAEEWIHVYPNDWEDRRRIGRNRESQNTLLPLFTFDAKTLYPDPANEALFKSSPKEVKFMADGQMEIHFEDGFTKRVLLQK